MSYPHQGSDIPENLCVMPFIHIGTKPDGVARVCCMAPQLEVTDGNRIVNFQSSSIEDTWNSEYMRALRMKMLSGKKLNSCSACWKQEATGPHSKRLRENRKYLHQFKDRILAAKETQGFVTEGPVYFDLRLGNKCNLKCRTCNPIFSNAWASELHKVEMTGLTGRVLDETQHMLTRADAMEEWYSEGFFEELKSLVPYLQEIYVSGGEPALISDLEIFLDDCMRLGSARNIEIRLNSNISILRDSFVEKLLSFKKVSFGASIDAFGAKNDWLRSPSQWARVITNLAKLYQISRDFKNFKLSANITLSIYNFYYVDELVTWLKESFPSIEFIFDFVSQPSYMSLDLIPTAMVEKAIYKLNCLNVTAFSKHEMLYIDQLKDAILRGGQTEKAQLVDEFLNHSHSVDQWRSENGYHLFPELFAQLEQMQGGSHREV